jgi:hypothetical protein
MSRKLTALIVGAVASLALLAGTMQGCGSSSGNSFQDLCNQSCDKALACTPDAGEIGQQANQACKDQCVTRSQQQCANAAAIASRIQECLNMQDCTAAGACVGTIPACQSTTGTGGSTSTGGTGGAGGAGAGDCSVCTKADQCCAALDPTANCVSASTCAAASGPDQTTIIGICQGVLNVTANQPSAPAACK